MKLEKIEGELGYFGNVWVRGYVLKKKGDSNNKGHKHHFDHVTLLVKGSLRVEVDGFEPTTYEAPTFIVTKKEYHHTLTALEDDTQYFCVFALRDIDGNVTDIYSGDNSPYRSAGAGGVQSPVVHSTSEQLKQLEKSTTVERPI